MLLNFILFLIVLMWLLNVVEWSWRYDQHCCNCTWSWASIIKAQKKRTEETRERGSATGSQQQGKYCQALVWGCTRLQLHAKHLQPGDGNEETETNDSWTKVAADTSKWWWTELRCASYILKCGFVMLHVCACSMPDTQCCKIVTFCVYL